MFRKFTFFVFFVLMPFIFGGCSGGSGSNTNSSSTPTVEKRKGEKEAEQNHEEEVREQEEEARVKAVNDYVNIRHKGWELRGVSETSYEDCSEPCDLHLVRGKESKIVSVIVRKFSRPDKTEYWHVYEATKLDIARIRLKAFADEAEERGREQGREAEREEQEAGRAWDEYPEPEDDYLYPRG